MTTTSAESVRPYFVPDDVDFDSLPETLKAAITAIINPAYGELVIAAREGLERSIGMTVVHLAWLEILEQLELGRQSGLTGDIDPSVDRQKLIERHLRLVGEGEQPAPASPGVSPEARAATGSLGSAVPIARTVSWKNGSYWRGRLVLENHDSVDQKVRAARQRVLALIGRHEQVLRTNGAVVESYRCCQGRRLGPFFRVAFRADRKQRSIYIGKDRDLVEEVRGRLAQLQTPLRERRALQRQKDAAKASLRKAKIQLEQELAQVGLSLQGYEVRGWRKVS